MDIGVPSVKDSKNCQSWRAHSRLLLDSGSIAKQSGIIEIARIIAIADLKRFFMSFFLSVALC